MMMAITPSLNAVSRSLFTMPSAFARVLARVLAPVLAPALPGSMRRYDGA